MSERTITGISVIRGDSDFDWREDPRPEGDHNPPGQETILFRSADRKMSCGFWRRVPEKGKLEPEFDEIMMILQGEVEITHGEGEVIRVGPGDVLAAPNGSTAGWRSLSPVYKFWAVHHGNDGDAGGAAVTALHGEDVTWAPSQIPADDAFAPGREAIAFQSGRFSSGLWERDRQDRDFERAFDEIAILLEGEIVLTTEEGTTLQAGAGDVVITPKGSRGHWRSDGPVRKFWAIYES